MKKILFSLIAIIISFNSLFSQGSSCLPDCFNSPFGPSIRLELFIPECNCTLVVYYSTRHACNTWWDYSINKIDVGFCGNCLKNQYNNDFSAFINLVTKALLVSNPGNFPPLQNGDPCENNWRVMKGSCWHGSILLGGGASGITYDQLAPCEGTNCCLEYFTVCMVNGVRVITQTGYQPPADPGCLNSGNPQECVPVCGTIYR